MTVTYSVNGTAIYGVEAVWQRVPKRSNVDGSIDYVNWADNIWRVDRMPVASYLILQTAQGGALTSFATNDIDDNNTGTTYATVILTELSSQGHRGLNFVGVEVIFRVKVS